MKPKKTYRRVIQIELNEISRPVIKSLLQAQKNLPHFARIEQDWHHSMTTSENEYELIEPWIQWITAHTGKAFADHGILHLGDVDRLQHPQIWELLSDRGVESAIVGSMNAVRGESTRGGVFFPDPWAKKGQAYPPNLQPLWQLISRRVQGHAVSEPTVSETLRALQCTLQFRMPPGLYLRIMGQLVAQRIDPLTKWRLAGLFDEFLAEIFIHILGDKKYRFCTLFLNAIAHYQHHYWRNFEPSRFSPTVEAPDCRSQDNPMQFGYQIYDKILGRILKQIDPQQDLVLIVSGLSQVPFTQKEDEGGMNYFRLRDHQCFLNSCGGGRFKAYPLMSRDWQVSYQNDEEKSELESLLCNLTVDGEKLFRLSLDHAGFIFVETAVTRSVSDTSPVLLGSQFLGNFGQYFVNIAIKSGHHTGIGSLWISDASVLDVRPQIALGEVFSIGLQSLHNQANLQ